MFTQEQTINTKYEWRPVGTRDTAEQYRLYQNGTRTAYSIKFIGSRKRWEVFLREHIQISELTRRRVSTRLFREAEAIVRLDKKRRTYDWEKVARNHAIANYAGLTV